MRGAVSPPLRRACRQCGHAGHAFALLALCSLVLVVAGVRAVQQYTHARLHGPHQLPRVPVTHSALSLLRVLLNGAWAKACPHLLHLGKSICDAWTANPFSWPFSCPVEPRWLSAGLAQLLPLLAAPLDTMRERLMRATLARPPAAAAAAAAAKESPDGCSFTVAVPSHLSPPPFYRPLAPQRCPAPPRRRRRRHCAEAQAHLFPWGSELYIQASQEEREGAREGAGGGGNLGSGSLL